jgi:hypothetical protein
MESVKCFDRNLIAMTKLLFWPTLMTFEFYIYIYIYIYIFTRERDL